ISRRRLQPRSNASRLKLLAGAKKPILSPGLRARGFKTVLSAKEFTLADDLCRPSQQYISAFPQHFLVATLRMDFYRRLHVTGGNGRHRRCARAGSGRLRLAHSAFKEAHINSVWPGNAHKFHIHSFTENFLLLDLRSLLLPCCRELFYEHYQVRIAHGNRSSGDLSRADFHGNRRTHFRFAHRRLKLESLPILRDQLTYFESRACLD